MDRERDPAEAAGPDGPGEASLSLVERALELLRPVAAAGGTVTYGELSQQFGPSAVDGAEGRPDLASVLRAVSLSEERAGRGLLSAVVVRPSGRPGGGWYRLAAEVGRDVTDPEACWAAERQRLVTAYGGGDPGPA